MARAMIGAVALLVLACAASPSSAAEPADILKIVPESSLLAIVARSPEAAATHFYKVAVPLGAEEPGEGEGAALDAILREMSLVAPGEDEDAPALPASVDLKGPMALVVVVPQLDVQGEPFAFIVRVTDYAAFLKDLAKEEGAAAPEVTADGTDVVRGKDSPCFCAQFGDFAALSDAEYVIRSLKQDAAKNLASGRVAGIRKAFDAHDVVLYGNPALAIKSFKPMLGGFMKQVREELEADPDMAGPFARKDTVETVMAVFDTVLGTGEETDAVVAGVTFSEKGVTGAIALQGVPDTQFARLAAAVKPMSADWLALFDEPFVMALSWNLDPQLSAELSGVYGSFVDRIKVPKGDVNRMKQVLQQYRGLVAGLSGSGGMLLGADEARKTLRITLVTKTPAAKHEFIAAGAEEDATKRTSALLEALGLKANVTLDKDPEFHRNISLGGATIRFRAGTDKEDALAADSAKLLRSVYGDEVRVLSAAARDLRIYDICAPDSAGIKALIDHALDDKKGSLVGSSAFAEAVAGFPADRAAACVFSVESFLQKLPGLARYMNLPVEGLRDVKFDKPSAIGLALAPAEKGVALYFNVPLQEMLNISKAVEAMDGAAAADGADDPPDEGMDDDDED